MNTVPSLDITSFLENNDDLNNDIDTTITKFEWYPRTVAIKEQMKNSNKTFTFQNVGTYKVASIIKKLNTKTASKSQDIPNKIIKEFETFIADFYRKI